MSSFKRKGGTSVKHLVDNARRLKNVAAKQAQDDKKAVQASGEKKRGFNKVP